MKLKTLFKTIVALQVRRALRSISSKTLNLIQNPMISKKQRSRSHVNNKIFFGSFRFHYNWCSSKRHSHVLPVAAPVFDGLPPNPESLSYYDATWHSSVPAMSNNASHESQLYGYLDWLEEKRVHGKAYGGDAPADDIDTLADMFIANSHAKFILEKQESARRFKEMLERSA